MRKLFKLISILTICILCASCTSTNGNRDILNSTGLLEVARGDKENGLYDEAVDKYLDIIADNPDLQEAYLEGASCYVSSGRYAAAMSLLKQGIMHWEGSASKKSKPLLDAWLEIVKNVDASRELPQRVADSIEINSFIFDCLNCFYFAEELDAYNAMTICDGFCLYYYDFQFTNNQEAMQWYPPEIAVPEKIVVLSKETTRKMMVDILGSPKFDPSYNDISNGFVAEFAKRYPEYDLYINSDDFFRSISFDPDPPDFTLKSYRSLGDGLFYIVMEQGWITDVETVMLPDLHLVIKENDSFFGFEIISVLQNKDESFLEDKHGE